MYTNSRARKVGAAQQCALGLMLFAGSMCQTAHAENSYRQHDHDLVLARTVYQTLLDNWGDARVAPQLRIVDDVTRVRASSQDDGVIILSRGAIKATLSGPVSHAPDRMAFVLAHELAHHRADHLWIQRWARLSEGRTEGKAGEQSEHGIAQMNNLAEWQADAEGLILMTLAGFDPHGVVGDSKFFVRWVEHAANIDCSGEKQQRPACHRARERTEFLKAQLSQLIPHAVVFELALQSYVAGDYSTARSLFSAFGQLFPEAAVYANLGAAYLAEAFAIRDKLLHRQFQLSVHQRLYYPLELSAETRLTQAAAGAEELSRGERLDSQGEQLLWKLPSLIQGAQAAFDDASRLAPGDRRILSHRIASYVVGGKINLAKGLLEDEYLNGDAADTRYHLLAGMILTVRHEHNQALEAFTKAMESAAADVPGLDGQFNVMAAAFNKALVLTLLGRDREKEELWQHITQSADAAGASALFRLALANLQGVPVTAERASSGNPFGDIALLDSQFGSAQAILPVNLGNRHARLIQTEDGSYQVRDEVLGVIAQWRKYRVPPDQSEVTESGDYERLIGLHGIPDRHIRRAGGVFLAYDAIRTGFQLRGNQLVKQFRYPSLGTLVNEH